MSYWDILTEDLQEYIVKLRDDEIDKHKFKTGFYCIFGRRDDTIEIDKINPKTIKGTPRFESKWKLFKIYMDFDNIPYIMYYPHRKSFCGMLVHPNSEKENKRTRKIYFNNMSKISY